MSEALMTFLWAITLRVHNKAIRTTASTLINITHATAHHNTDTPAESLLVLVGLLLAVELLTAPIKTRSTDKRASRNTVGDFKEQWPVAAI